MDKIDPSSLPPAAYNGPVILLVNSADGDEEVLLLPSPALCGRLLLAEAVPVTHGCVFLVYFFSGPAARMRSEGHSFVSGHSPFISLGSARKTGAACLHPFCYCVSWDLS